MPSSHRNPWPPPAVIVVLALTIANGASAADRHDAGALEGATEPGSGGVLIVAVDDGPAGPAPALEELADQLRAACRERAPDVVTGVEVTRRLRLVARTPLPDLERTYAAAQAAYQADEVDTALRLLHGVAGDLESSPDGAPVHELWVRTQVRIAVAERAQGRRDRMEEALARVLALDPDLAVDPDQYAPSFRRDVEEVRRKITAAQRRELTITAPLPGLVAYVGGKEVGPLPARVRLPPGRYRITASRERGRDATAAPIVTPAAWVEIGDADQEVTLETAVSAALRVGAGPGLAAARSDRAQLVVALGRWGSAAQVIAVDLAGDLGSELVASLYDTGTGALVREARAHLRGGSLPGASVAAMASYLLAGTAPAPGPDVARRGTTLVLGADAPAPRPPPARWLRPAAYGAGVLAVGALAVAVLQARASARAYGDASAMVRADGALVPGADRARYDGAIRSGDGARRSAYVAAGTSAALAVAAAVLGYLSGAPRDPPTAALRF